VNNRLPFFRKNGPAPAATPEKTQQNFTVLPISFFPFSLDSLFTKRHIPPDKRLQYIQKSL
jgi:hypothetical protein